MTWHRAALVVALVAASCSSPGHLTRQEFIDQANAVCAESSARLGGIAAPDPSEPDLVAEAITEIVVVQRGALDDLDDLRPPDGIEPHVEEWLGLVGDVLDSEEEVARAVADGDLAAADAANAEAAATNTEADQLATELGLGTCTMAGPVPPVSPDAPAPEVPATDPG